ncbi:hypothetical protein B0T22DRAFT_86784 [Podospora appendiculata]|uniref:Uncharacterized protein n=1 Tax=Podospora appendiculata TaxID=314037 RepID=A0AAE0XK15_9PEZI|nr:hypothetical protein B0T22DRAFT_86784 [Podospora appendiculata]
MASPPRGSREPLRPSDELAEKIIYPHSSSSPRKGNNPPKASNGQHVFHPLDASFRRQPAEAAEAGNGFQDVEIGSQQQQQQLEKQQRPSSGPGTRQHHARKYFSSASWWQEEYWCALLCVVTATSLALLLHHYDDQVVPELGWGIQIDTAIIALVTVVRVSMKAFVETAVSQGAWIWVSEMSQRRCRHSARLSDFKVFDEASRGLWGSLCLLWRLKLR